MELRESGLDLGRGGPPVELIPKSGVFFGAGYPVTQQKMQTFLTDKAEFQGRIFEMLSHR